MNKVLVLLSSVFVILISSGCGDQEDKVTKLEAEQQNIQKSNSAVKSLDTVKPRSDKNVVTGKNPQLTEVSIDREVEQESNNSSSQKIENPSTQEITADIISGTISTKNQTNWPENALLTVILEDIPLGDIPAKSVSEQTFLLDGLKAPFDFELSYDLNKIEETRKYIVRVRIEIGGKLLFITNKMYRVINDDDNTKNIDVELIGV